MLEYFKQGNNTDEPGKLGKISCVTVELHGDAPERLVCSGLWSILIWVIDKVPFLYVSLSGNTEPSRGTR